MDGDVGRVDVIHENGDVKVDFQLLKPDAKTERARLVRFHFLHHADDFFDFSFSESTIRIEVRFAFVFLEQPADSELVISPGSKLEEMPDVVPSGARCYPADRLISPSERVSIDLRRCEACRCWFGRSPARH